jgi:hypothetical protein
MKLVRLSQSVHLGAAAMTARNASLTSSAVIAVSALPGTPLLRVPTYIGPPGRNLSHERDSAQRPLREAGHPAHGCPRRLGCHRGASRTGASQRVHSNGTASQTVVGRCPLTGSRNRNKPRGHHRLGARREAARVWRPRDAAGGDCEQTGKGVDGKTLLSQPLNVSRGPLGARRVAPEPLRTCGGSR